MSVLVIPLLAQALSVSVGDRTETRVRTGVDSPVVDAVTQPQASIRATGTRASWALTYAPTISQLELGSPSSEILVVHAGSLTGQLRLSPRTMLQLAESGSYGSRNFRSLSVAAVDPSGLSTSSVPSSGGASSSGTATPVPVSSSPSIVEQTLRFGSISTGASLSHRFSARWEGGLGAGYSSSGGLDQVSQERIPRLTRLEGTARVAYAATSRDDVSLRAESARMGMSVSSQVYLETLEVGWFHALTRSSNVTLSLGTSYWRWDGSNSTGSDSLFSATSVPYVRREPTTNPERDGLLPVGTLAYSRQWSLHRRDVTLNLTESVRPIVDRILGTVNQSATSLLSLGIRIEKVTFQAGASATFIDSNMPTSTRYAVGGTQVVGYRINRHFTLEGGARESLIGRGDGAAVPAMWAGFVALSYSSGDIRL